MRKTLFAALVALFFASQGWAQFETAEITGTARDQTGAVIPGVRVTALHVSTGTKVETSTDADGNYVLRPLRIGEYQLTAEIAGFRKAQRSGIVLQVNQRARVDFEMQVGELAETVVVTGTAPLIETESSSRGQVIDNRKVLELPLITRDYTQLATLSVGVAPPGGRFLGGGGVLGQSVIGTMNINGNRTMQNDFLIDGVDANTLSTNIQEGTVSYVNPNPDAIQEFKVQTSNYSAEFGKSAGAVINVSIKSGTNDFHGSVYEFHRDNAISARNFFAGPGPKPLFIQNQFGFAIGGPIKRDKTFFFADYQGTRIRKGVTLVSTVPSLALRGGDFRGLAPVRDPQSGQPFAGNVIPPERIDPVARAYANLYPAPNIAGREALSNNFVANPLLTDRVDQFDVRVDHHFSDKMNFFARYSHTSRDFVNPTRFTGLAEGADNPDASGRDSYEARHIAVSLTNIISSAVVNEFRFGYGRGFPFRAPANFPGPSATESLRDLTGGLVVPFPDIPGLNGGLPEMQIRGFTRIGRPFFQPKFQISETVQFKDSVSFVRGPHSMKAGVDIRHAQLIFFDVRATIGGYAFEGVFTGNPFADFLLGAAERFFLTSQTRVDQGQDIFNFFFQDDWKATSRLTLNLGIRYEFATPTREVQNRLANFDIARQQLVQAKDGSLFDRALVEPDKNNFAPRLGLAYQLDSKTVLRAGYGVFYVHEDRRGSESQLALNPPFLVDLQVISDRVTPAAILRNGLPPALIDPARINLAGAFLRIQDMFQRTAYVQQWNFTLQRELPGQIVVDAAYVGNKGTKLPALSNLNQAAPGPGPLADRVPFKGFGTLQFLENRDSSNYHAFQLRVEKRLSRGFSFLSSYTFSKALNQATENMVSGTNLALGIVRSPQDRNNLRAERGPAEFDLRNRFVFSYIWELPFGKERRWGKGWSGALNSLLGSWQMSGITTIQSGRSLTLFLSAGLAPNLGAERAPRPDLLRDPNLSRSQRTLERFFDTSAFANPSDRGASFGNAGRGLVHGPGMVNFDLSLFKNIPLSMISEAARLQFRTEIFNLWNTPQFVPPAMALGGAGFGAINRAFDGRQFQFALKLLF